MPSGQKILRIYLFSSVFFGKWQVTTQFLMSKVLYWFRRDLRLIDNTALHHAAQSGAQVIPVYILSGWKKAHGWTGPKRQQFLCSSLESLSKNLEHLGSRLIFRAGDAVEELGRLLAETGAEAIYFNRDPDPFGKKTEQRLRTLAVERGVKIHDFKDSLLHEYGEVLSGSGTPYRVYTPYSKNWLSLAKASALPKVNQLGPAVKIDSLPVPTLEHWQLSLPADAQLLPAGERAARARMEHFLNGSISRRYDQDRNLPAGQHNSLLSQDLRFGLIGIRELYHNCESLAQGEPSAKNAMHIYIKELAWREFYAALLHYYPGVLDRDFNPDYANVPWPGDEEQLERWKTGQTGFPIVDAGMRQLICTGLMHNRVRMIVAMFLTKDLHHHWSIGEQFFHQHLIDAEIGSNNGGWQWSAGTGADAAPYFRIQNPWTQTKNFDPGGEYIRQWVPELAGLSGELFQAPPKDGKSLAKGYPLPVVDHSTERDRCLAYFKLNK
jgi:deoxyribodipyrimidine photo-lyase